MLYDHRKEREGEKNSKSTFGGIYHSDLIPRSPKEKQQENIVVRPNFNFRSLLTVPQASPPIQAKSAEIPANESVKEEVTVNEPIIQEKSEEKPNLTGLPDDLKAGVENLSGYSLDDVRVHYNSSKPAQLQALAYTQGTEIHVGPGQEKHLAHEAWHVVQQKQGRVKPTMQMKGVQINDEVGLESEAYVMGGKATTPNMISPNFQSLPISTNSPLIAQLGKDKKKRLRPNESKKRNPNNLKPPVSKWEDRALDEQDESYQPYTISREVEESPTGNFEVPFTPDKHEIFWRGDTRGPKEVFNQGFTSRNERSGITKYGKNEIIWREGGLYDDIAPESAVCLAKDIRGSAFFP